jgi:hypothetical protein
MIPFEDQELVLRDVVDRFGRLGIPYMLTGSIALIWYAMQRMTNDIDIVVEITETDAQRIVAEFEKDFYVPIESVREAIRRKSLFNLLHTQMLVRIDCVIRKDAEFDRQAFSNRTKRRLSGHEFFVISRDDLILSKLRWGKSSGSELQMRDVANILRNGFDREYVESWAAKLGVEEYLERTLKLLEQNYVDGYDSRD